jgi:hypothetical protein
MVPLPVTPLAPGLVEPVPVEPVRFTSEPLGVAEPLVPVRAVVLPPAQAVISAAVRHKPSTEAGRMNLEEMAIGNSWWLEGEARDCCAKPSVANHMPIA